jgi:uncharacterized protein (DUF885 family)
MDTVQSGTAQSADDAVNVLADELLEAMLDALPVDATLLGLTGPRDGLLSDYSAAGEQAAWQRVEEIAARAAALDPHSLSTSGRATRAVILQQVADMATRTQTRMTEYTLCASFTCPAVGLLITLPMIGTHSTEQSEAYLARLAGIPDALRALADRHRDGIAAGRVPVRHLVEATVAHIDRYLENSAADPLAKPGPQDDAEYARRREAVLADVVRPAFAVYRDVLRDEIAPHGRDREHVGLCWLPDGAQTYERLIALHTTTSRTADELHQTGLDVVARLADEYREIGGRVFGLTEPAEIFDRLRNDPQLRWQHGDEILDAARTAIARAEAAAPDWFGRLPDHSCEVRAVPDDEAATAPFAYYLPPAVDGSRPGIYFANTSEPTERDRPSIESTTFHEAVPGHHFQLTIALNLTGLPMLRRIAPFTAYAEGWGLYAERLADEMGLYSDDIARLGMLVTDSLRAARLVVDTGMHAKGWSREQAVAYMQEYTPVVQVEIESEIDRYIADPGQALAYMVGRLEIQRIRALAQQRLGGAFDVKAFHDAVLGAGALPLSTLAEIIDDWTAEQG